MVFVVISLWFILVTTDLATSTLPRDVTAPSSPGQTDPPVNSVTTSPPQAVTSPATQIASTASGSSSTGFPNGTVASGQHTFAGNPESRNETNQNLSASLNDSKSCACSPNTQACNTSVDSAAKLLGCPCVEPVRLDNNTSSVCNVSLATNTALIGPKPQPLTLEIVTYGGYGKFTLKLNLEREDLKDLAYNVLKAIQLSDDCNVDEDEASLIRLLDGEKLIPTRRFQFKPYYNYILKDFIGAYRLFKFRSNGAKNPCLIKTFHPWLAAAYLKALKTRKSSILHRVFYRNFRPPFTGQRPWITMAVLPNQVGGKSESISQIINRLKQVLGDTCRLKLLNQTIIVPGCAAKTITVTTCQGSCRSSIYPEWMRTHIEHHESCTSCGNAGIETRWHRIQCIRKRNRNVYVRIDNPTKCFCRKCHGDL